MAEKEKKILLSLERNEKGKRSFRFHFIVIINNIYRNHVPRLGSQAILYISYFCILIIFFYASFSSFFHFHFHIGKSDPLLPLTFFLFNIIYKFFPRLINDMKEKKYFEEEKAKKKKSIFISIIHTFMPFKNHPLSNGFKSEEKKLPLNFSPHLTFCCFFSSFSIHYFFHYAMYICCCCCCCIYP